MSGTIFHPRKSLFRLVMYWLYRVSLPRPVNNRLGFHAGLFFAYITTKFDVLTQPGLIALWPVADPCLNVMT